MINKSISIVGGFVKLCRAWVVVYIFAFLSFQYVLFKACFIPWKLLLPIELMCLLLSALTCFQLFSHKIKINAKIMAFIISTLLIAAYLIAIVYVSKTLFFLGSISYEDNRRAGSTTTKPFNIYITGIDTYGSINKSGRSDENMIASINPKTRKILLTSIPRDYEIRLKKHRNAVDKLTHTGFYGVDDSICAIEDLIGIKINYYIKVNFSTVEKFIDAIDGITVYSDYSFSTKNYGHNEKIVSIKKGKNKLNGAEALSFSRERHSFKDGDNQRIKNQQKVLEEILKRGLKNRKILIKYTKVLDSLQPYFKTNLSSKELSNLIRLQLKYSLEGKGWTIEENSIEGFNAVKNTYSVSNTYVMTQNKKSINSAKKKIQKVFKDNE